MHVLTMRRGVRLLVRALAVMTALMLTCAFEAAGQAPQADAGLLRWYQGDRELGRESFSRTADLFETETVVPMLNLRVRYRSEYAGARLARFEGRLFDLRADTLIRTYTLAVDGDSLRIRQADGRPADRTWVRAATIDAVMPGQSLAAMLELVQRASRGDTAFVVWSPERRDSARLPVRFRGDTAELEIGTQPLRVLLGATGRAQEIRIAIQNLRAVRWDGRDSLPPLAGMDRPPPDYSAPAGAPYTAQELRIPVRRDSVFYTLACTFTRPSSGRPPYPAALTITGSGLQDRDESLWPLLSGYRPFREVADRLGRAGIAVLRCDDRGFGGSTGDVSAVTTEDFADDVRWLVAYLGGRRDVDRRRIALVGHSEGGIIAPMVAASDSSVAAVVLMAGTAKNGVEVLKDQALWAIPNTPDLSAEQRERMRVEAVRAVEADTASNAWMRFFRSYEPLPAARRVRQPALILQGALDRQVTAGQADTLAAAMREGGNRDVTVRVFQRLNHLFLISPTDGSPGEYASLREVAVSPEVLDTMAEWLLRRLAVRRTVPPARR